MDGFFLSQSQSQSKAKTSRMWPWQLRQEGRGLAMSQVPWSRPPRTTKVWVIRRRCKCSRTYNLCRLIAALAGVYFSMEPTEWMEEVRHPKFLLLSSGNGYGPDIATISNNMCK